MSLSGMPGPEVRLRGVELLWLNLHLRSPHVSALGATEDRPVVVARVMTGSADGWGECAALVTPNYSEEYADGVWSVMRDFLVPLLLAGSRSDKALLPGAAALPVVLESIRGHAMAKACLEMAVLDATLRSADRSLAAAIGAARARVEAGAVVGLADPSADQGNDREAAFMRVEQLESEGYSRVKFKIAPGADVGTFIELRRAFPAMGFQADANGSFRLDEPSHLADLRALDDLGLLCIEQPLDPEDLAGHAELADILTTPVCLDESVWSLGRLREAIESRACDMVCIKPSRLGGLLKAVEAHDICTDANIPVWCGGMLETAPRTLRERGSCGPARIRAPGGPRGW